MAPHVPTASDTTLPPGSMVGEYQIGSRLGEGGMGVVYAGQHPVIGKRVAVKVLSSAGASDPDLVRRFVEEARAVNRVGHPNIIDIFSFGQLPDGRQYFVMEFLDGESLADRLATGDIEPTELRRFLRQICGALEAAHREGIIHRDLKPENIWIASPKGEDAYAKLLDFGIAKLVDLDTAKVTRTGAAMGSPQFMPPEQCMGRPVDRRADIYAMGVILYRVFSGTLPFQGRSLAELIYQQTTQAPIAPSRHRAVDRDIERIILDCLQKEPDRRPGSARELGERLERAFSRMKTGPATPVRAKRPIPAATPYRRALPGLLVAGGALMVLLGAFVVSRTRSRRDAPPEGKPVGALVEKATEATMVPSPALRGSSLAQDVSRAPRAEVVVRIRSVPPGARVMEMAHGSVLGTTPIEIKREWGSGSLALRLNRKGWKPLEVEVPLGDDFEGSYTLDKIVAPVHRPAARAPVVFPAHKQEVPTPESRKNKPLRM